MFEKDESEELKTAQLLMVIMVVAFSTLLIVLNILMEWEIWTIPVLALMIPSVVIMHIRRKPEIVLRTNIYTTILLVEMFYYISQIETVYDGCGVIVVMLVIFTTTNRRLINWLCFLIGNIGLIIHLFQKNAEDGLTFMQSNIVRTVWCFLILFIAAVVTDRMIVMRRRSINEYEQKIRQSEEVNRSAGDFLANVSHEIRTPINAVIGLSGVCIDREDDVDIRMDLNSIRDAGKRVAEQVSDILDYSEIDQDKLAVSKEDYMISSVLNDLVLGLQPYLRPEIELVIDVDPEVPSMMNTDVSKLKKILWHLVMNGLKYTKTGAVYVHITTKPQEYGVNLFIEVEDTGVGMDEEELERVFDRFYQSDSGRDRSTSGLGLGLPIVAGFVHVLGGFITVESEVGKGTKVRVSIPQKVIDNSECMSVIAPKELRIAGYLRFDKFPHPMVREFYNSTVKNILRGLNLTMHRVDNVEDLKQLVSETELTHLFVAEDEYKADAEYIDKLSEQMIVEVVTLNRLRLAKNSRVNIMRKPFYCFPVTTALNMYWHIGDEDEGRLYCPGVRALVVDDEPMNLTVALGVFRGYGMIVETAESGMESIEMCRKTPYDIVFMDHMMPGMDGVEAMKRLRMEAGRLNREFPIVALTANAVSSAKEMFMREGFDGFVSKPIETLELERVLKRVLSKSAVRYMKNEVFTAEEKSVGNEKVSATEETTSADVIEFSPSGDSGKKDDSVDLSELEKYDIDSRTGMRYCQDDAAFYRRLLLQFASESDTKKTGMKESLEKEDFDQYAIFVHALKSTSKMIGAPELSERARQLEDAAKEKNGTYIRSAQDEVLELYEKVLAGIRAVCGEPEAKPQTRTDVAETPPEPAPQADGLEVIEFAPKGGADV